MTGTNYRNDWSMKRLLDILQYKITSPYRAVKNSKSQKVFCIGKNKTGTTSMAHLFRELGLEVGVQRKAEVLTEDWLHGEYSRLIRYVKYGGQAFQDIPFSLPGTYKVLDRAFPDSLFILTERKNADVWCDSLINFHSKVFGNGQVPTRKDLQEATYVYKGFAWEMMNALHTVDPENIYDRAVLISDYERYNRLVKEYFANANHKLLVVTLEDENIVEKVKCFLNIEAALVQMPWENKTSITNYGGTD